jgi:DNA-binding sugar fermentation-stimulating protein
MYPFYSWYNVVMFDTTLQNQLVKARLQNEEIESELVRYKLL